MQVYSNLAYGVQGLQYFTYWTPTPGTWDFHDAPIDITGKRTVVYDRVKEVNREVQALRGVFLGAKVESLGHTVEKLPRGTRPYQPAAPIKEVNAGGNGAVVSQLTNGGRRFLVVVNRDVNAPMPLEVTVEGWTPFARVEKDGTLRGIGGLRHSASVGPGDIFILTWQAGERPAGG